MLKKIYVDAMPLVDNRLSGIGHSILQTLRALENLPGFSDKYQLILLVPFTKRGSMHHWSFKHAREKVYPFPGRFMSKADVYHLLPPMDLIFGRGVYLFMNFKNWPISPMSKSITYLHDICYAIYPQYVQPKNQRYLIQNVPRWIKRTSIAVTVSETAAKELAEYYPDQKDKVRVVTNGVDTKDYYPSSQDKITAAKEKYGVKGRYICFLSTIEPRKNLDTLLSSLEELHNKGHKISLLLIGGKGWLNEETFAHIDRARKAGCTVVYPETYVPDEDLPPLLTGAEMLVQPSFHEGFGVAPLQAMACSTPVIASNIPVLTEILGDACLYYETADSKSLTKQIIALLTQPKLVADLTSKGLQRVKRYSWEQAAKSLVRLFE